ncbi:hypothetical protein ACJX0J_008484, partial [Zea mays]
MPLREICANGNGGSSEMDPRASSCRSEYRRGLVVGGALGIACHGNVAAADPPLAAALLLYFPITAGIPHLKWFRVEGQYNVMVIDLLGPSLKGLFNYRSRKFSLKTVLMLADQMNQGFMTRNDLLLKENSIDKFIVNKMLSRREKATNFKPDYDIDIHMKVLAMSGQESSILTAYKLKIPNQLKKINNLQYPRPQGPRHCTSRRSRAGPRLIEIGRP